MKNLKSFITVGLLCLTLVLSACSGGTSSIPAPSAESSPGTQTAAPGASSPQEASAGWQPTKTITLICPFNPGSVGDTFSRPFAEIMSKYAGVQVVVENMGGGSGSIGTTAMINKPADGYTFSYHSNTGALNTAGGTAPFGVDDVLPFANICSDYHTVTVKADSPFQSFEEMVDYAHENPGALQIGGAQIMGNNHLFALLMMRDFEIDAAYIPYDDGASSALGLMGDNVDLLMSTNSVAAPFVKSGDFRVLAYTLKEPQPDMEELGVPTFASLGSKGLENYISFKGMFIHPDTPDEIKAWYDDIGQKVCSDPAWLKLLEMQGQVNTYMGMEEFSAYYKQYVANATEVFAGIPK